MKRKNEEKTPILYEKFKRDREEKPLEYPAREKTRSVGRKLSDIVVILVLLVLIVLATVGTITLINPVLRNAFMENIYACLL